jgi:hypothetical protein
MNPKTNERKRMNEVEAGAAHKQRLRSIYIVVLDGTACNARQSRELLFSASDGKPLRDPSFHPLSIGEFHRIRLSVAEALGAFPADH